MTCLSTDREQEERGTDSLENSHSVFSLQRRLIRRCDSPVSAEREDCGTALTYAGGTFTAFIEKFGQM